MAKEKLEWKKIVLLLLLIIVLIVGGVLLIDLTGKILGVQLDIPLLDRMKASTVRKAIKKSENIYLLEREELAKKEDKVKLMEEIVFNRENELKSRENEVNKKYEAVMEREKELDKKTAMLEERDQQYIDRKKNIREQALKLYNMPPEDAAVLLEKLTEVDVIEILRAIDDYSEELGSNSTSPYILKLIKDINETKAADILAKLKFEAAEEYTGVDILEDANLEIPPAP